MKRPWRSPFSVNNTVWGATLLKKGLKLKTSQILKFLEDLYLLAYPEAALHRYSLENVFWKYAANLLENTHAKCDFSKVAQEIYWYHTSAWVFFSKFAVYFQNTSFWEHPWKAASAYPKVHLALYQTSMTMLFWQGATFFLESEAAVHRYSSE